MLFVSLFNWCVDERLVDSNNFLGIHWTSQFVRAQDKIQYHDIMVFCYSVRAVWHLVKKCCLSKLKPPAVRGIAIVGCLMTKWPNELLADSCSMYCFLAYVVASNDFADASMTMSKKCAGSSTTVLQRFSTVSFQGHNRVTSRSYVGQGACLDDQMTRKYSSGTDSFQGFNRVSKVTWVTTGFANTSYVFGWRDLWTQTNLFIQ